MFDFIQKRLTAAVDAIGRRSKLTDKNIKDTLKEVRQSLLEADVALPIVKTLLAQIRSKALGKRVTKSLSPGQELVKIVQSELEDILGNEVSPLNLAQQPPAVILLIGLQGAGKTTTAGKLAHYVKHTSGKGVMLASVDVHRQAAIEQLQQLAEAAAVPFAEVSTSKDALKLAKRIYQYARQQHQEVVVIDTAGRNVMDDAMMKEVITIQKELQPVETLFVLDAMAGQQAVHIAKEFNQRLQFTGMIASKADSDARAGALLSARYITGKPIKFLGTGEKMDALEVFYPQRIVKRILGMGDVLGFIEEVEKKVDKNKLATSLKKMQQNKPFDFDDMKAQLQQMNQLGDMGNLLDRLPGGQQAIAMMEAKGWQAQANRMVAMIDSMTAAERNQPQLLNGSRKRRITAGSGTTIQDLGRMIKQYKNMSKVSKRATKGGMDTMLKKLSGNFSPKNLLK